MKLKQGKCFKWHACLYATYYGILKSIAKKYGYALTIHGSLQRDLDLVAIPWVEKPKDHLKMLFEFKRAVGFSVADDKKPYDSVEQKPHGRLAYTISTGAGGYIDISVMPKLNKSN